MNISICDTCIKTKCSDRQKGYDVCNNHSLNELNVSICIDCSKKEKCLMKGIGKRECDERIHHKREIM